MTCGAAELTTRHMQRVNLTIFGNEAVEYSRKYKSRDLHCQYSEDEKVKRGGCAFTVHEDST